MECPKCHFALSPFDVDCPRCKNFATLGVVLPTPVSAQNSESILSTTDALENPIQADSPDAAGKPWYSQLDLEDKGSNLESLPAETKPATVPLLAIRPVRPTPKPVTPPAPVFVPRVPRNDLPRRDIQDAPTVRIRPSAASNPEKRPFFLLGGIAALVVLILLVAGVETMSRQQSAKADRMLSQASDLISHANATRSQFQQTDLTPEDAAYSLHSRTVQYQAALRLCRASQAPGGAQTSLRIQEEATNGLKHVEADASAQAARLLTAEVAEDIARYKGATLTNEQAASIRATLQAQCQSALADCAQSLHDDPMNSIALLERVRAFRYLGNRKSADAALVHALVLYPDNPILLAEKGNHP